MQARKRRLRRRRRVSRASFVRRSVSRTSANWHVKLGERDAPLVRKERAFTCACLPHDHHHLVVFYSLTTHNCYKDHCSQQPRSNGAARNFQQARRQVYAGLHPRSNLGLRPIDPKPPTSSSSTAVASGRSIASSSPCIPKSSSQLVMGASR